MVSPRGDGEFTRRTLLGSAAAAAGAVSLARPADGLASALDPRPGVFGRWVGSLNGNAVALVAPRRFSLVGVEWAAPADARIELRTRAGDGNWGRWAVASVLGHGPDHRPDTAPTASSARAFDTARHPAALFGEAIWTGPADWVALRSAAPVRGLRLHFVSPQAPRAGIASAALPLAVPVLEAGPGQPPIISRDAWAQGHAPPRVPPAYGSVRLAFVHHTETPNGYSRGEVPAILRSIYQFHRYVRGWNDIGYNFAIDAFGQIWEARTGGIDEAVIGAQAGGYNLVSTGVAVLGSFTGVVPSPAAIDALQRLLAWKLSLHGVPALGRVTVEVDPADAFFTPFAPGAHVSLPRVAGHRDGDSTSCPGNAFYARLPAIRPRVAALAGTPANVTLTAAPAVVTPAGPVTLSGRLTQLAGPPVGGAPIELQQVTAQGAKTIATTNTAADGSWSTVVAPESNLLVRALHRPAPATVSDVAFVGVRPALTLNVDSVSPLRLSGTVSSSKRTVTIDLYALVSGRRRLVASKRVAVRQGRFAARIRSHRHGPLLLVARTDADARNIAGASPAVRVTL
jgi:N-acetylmuramoyl-L-alanine amidase